MPIPRRMTTDRNRKGGSSTNQFPRGSAISTRYLNGDSKVGRLLRSQPSADLGCKQLTIQKSHWPGQCHTTAPQYPPRYLYEDPKVGRILRPQPSADPGCKQLTIQNHWPGQCHTSVENRRGTLMPISQPMTTDWNRDSIYQPSSQHVTKRAGAAVWHRDHCWGGTLAIFQEITLLRGVIKGILRRFVLSELASSRFPSIRRI
jgi:hypothetical protein